jgi:hypothetical protein
MLNQFAANNGNIVLNNGTVTQSNLIAGVGGTPIISIAQVLVPNDSGGVQTGQDPLLFATTLAHELGHMVSSGGAGGSADNPNQAIVNEQTHEGVAVASEYIVALQLGLTGVNGAPTMTSDPNNTITPQLSSDAQLAGLSGINISQLQFNTPIANAFVYPGSQAVTDGGAWYGQQIWEGSGITYDTHASAAWVLQYHFGIDPNTVNWPQVTNSLSVQENADGTYSFTTGLNGIPILPAGGSGGGGSVQIDAQFSSTGMPSSLLEGSVNPNGTGTLTTVQNGQTATQTFNTSAQEYGEIGATFGSSLGRILAGSNAFAQIGAGTVLGTLGQEIGGLIAAETTPGLDVEKAIDGLVSGNEILSSVEGQGVGAISAYLIGDLFKDIGLTGAPAQIVQSLAGQTVSQIATNLINLGDPIYDTAGNVIGNVAWDTGINLGANLENIAGGFVGTELGNLVFSASTVQGEDGEAVGSAVGGEIGTLIAPGIGTAIGAFIGDIIGGLIGDLFGEPTTSAISLASLHPSGSDTTPLSYSFTTSLYQGGSQATANSMGDAVMGALNALLSEVGGVVSNESALSQFTVGVNTDSTLGQVFYYDDNTTGVRTQYQASDTTLQQVLDYSVLRELSEMIFSGGDVYVERAIDYALRTSATPAMTSLTGAIQIAEDYETYEANKTVIDALIEADPTSAFSAGWIAELAIAAQMGYGTSVQGGPDNDTLGVANGNTILIGGGGDDTYVINPGDGAVTIENGVSYDNAPNGNLVLNTPGLYFTESSNPVGPGATNMTFTQSGADLVIGWSGSTDSVTLRGWFAGSFAELNQITLANGTIISLVDIQKFFGQQTIVGTEFNNQLNLSAEATYNIGIEGANDFTNSSNAITGGDGADILAGGSGANDFINGGGTGIAYGGGGADIYEMDAPGNLTIYNNETTTGAVMGSGPSGSLVFGAATGDTAAELSFTQDGANLVIDGGNDGSVVTIENWFVDSYAQLASITAADGVTIGYDASYDAMSAIVALPNGGRDYEYWGLGGQFVTQNQYFTASMVNYEIVTQTTADTWVIDSGLAGAGTPALSFTLPAGFTASQISFADSSGNLVIADEAGATVTVDGWFTNPYAPLSLVTADGVTITDTNGVLSEPTTLNGSAAEEYWLFGTGQSWSYGAAGAFNLAGSGDTLSVGAGSAVSLEAGDPSDTVNLSSGSVSEASGVTGIIVNGSNNALTMNGGNYLYIESGTGNFSGGADAANDAYSRRAA